MSVTVGEKRGISSLLDDSFVSDSDDPFCSDSDLLNDHTEQESEEETVVFTTQANRRDEKRQRYLKGVSRKPHRVSKELGWSFEDSDSAREPSLSNSNSMSCHSEPSQWNRNVCKSCAPVLQKYADAFASMKRQVSELKKRKSINPQPKKAEPQRYRDLVKQNEWLRSNIFDAVGNYLFCCRCVHHALGISFQRLSRQRKVKRSQYAEPLRSILKSEVKEKNLSQYVIMPQGCESSFMAWWKLLMILALPQCSILVKDMAMLVRHHMLQKLMLKRIT